MSIISTKLRNPTLPQMFRLRVGRNGTKLIRAIAQQRQSILPSRILNAFGLLRPLTIYLVTKPTASQINDFGSIVPANGCQLKIAVRINYATEITCKFMNENGTYGSVFIKRARNTCKCSMNGDEPNKTAAPCSRDCFVTHFMAEN